MTLKDYLYSSGKIEANNYVIIKQSGWRVGMVYVDHEDLSTLALPKSLLNSEVKFGEWVDHPDFTKKIYEIHIK